MRIEVAFHDYSGSGKGGEYQFDSECVPRVGECIELPIEDGDCVEGVDGATAHHGVVKSVWWELERGIVLIACSLVWQKDGDGDDDYA